MKHAGTSHTEPLAYVEAGRHYASYSKAQRHVTAGARKNGSPNHDQKDQHHPKSRPTMTITTSVLGKNQRPPFRSCKRNAKTQRVRFADARNLAGAASFRVSAETSLHSSICTRSDVRKVPPICFGDLGVPQSASVVIWAFHHLGVESGLDLRDILYKQRTGVLPAPPTETPTTRDTGLCSSTRTLCFVGG